MYMVHGKIPYGQYAGVYAKFSECMQKDKPITIFGDGMQSRDLFQLNRLCKQICMLHNLIVHYYKVSH